jgi:hypothetical protein
MLKRTKGRLLLVLLVCTGLAGTLNNSSLSQKERKQAISLIKSSRNEVLASVNRRTIDWRITCKYGSNRKDMQRSDKNYHGTTI